ncbi:MAG: TldD/PmbA family protein [Deltaproteobacteria bacterium]|nr:TldD/PmbA family protein [Deltaproteobacteria bacterium]
MFEALGVDVPVVLRTALRGGGEFADLFFERVRQCYVLCEGGSVANITQGVRRGVGVRVIYRGRTAYAHGEVLTTRSLVELAETVAAMARENAPGVLASVERPLSNPLAFEPTHPSSGLELAGKIALCQRADRAAHAADPRIRYMEVLYVDSQRELAVANCLGERSEETLHSLRFSAWATALGDDGKRWRSYHGEGGVGGLERFDEVSPEQIGREAAQRAVLNLDAPPAPAGRMPVILAAEAGGALLHEAVGHGLEADLVHGGTSCYAGRLGERLAASKVSIADDPTLPGLRGTYRFDHEAVPSRRTLLIDRGILAAYLYDRVHALRHGASSTGNGRRESYRFPPQVRMSNIFALPGDDDPEAILRGTPSGLYVRKMGSGQVDTLSGDFVFRVSEGYLIENGALGPAVRGATLTGNGPEVLQAIDAVGPTLKFSPGICAKGGQDVAVSDGQPMLRIQELLVGGESD